MAAETEPMGTATLQLLIDGLASKFVTDAGDALMVSLLGHAKVIDPLVSSDLDAGQLSVSFEFAATGNVQADIRHAMRLLQEAAEGGQSRQFDWSRWFADTDLGRTGSVQYPLVGAVASRDLGRLLALDQPRMSTGGSTARARPGGTAGCDPAGISHEDCARSSQL